MNKNSKLEAPFDFASVAFVISFLARFGASAFVPFLLIEDSAWYASSAQSFLETGKFIVSGYPNNHSLPAYSILISPAYLAANIDKVFLFIKLINSLLMSSAIFPIFFIFKKYLQKDDLKYYIVAALTLSHHFYTFTVMAESLYYPLFWTVMYLFDRSIFEKGIITKVAFLVGTIALLATKASGLVMPIIVLIVVTYAVASKDVGYAATGLLAIRTTIQKNKKGILICLLCLVVIIVILLALYGQAVVTYPYKYDLQQYIESFRNIKVARLLGWQAIYIGQLNIATGFVVLPAAMLYIISITRSRELWNRPEIIIFLTTILVVITLAGFQSGYRFARITERHFFVIVPITLALAFRGINAKAHRLGFFEIILGWCLIGCSGAALYWPSMVGGPGIDSPSFDLIKLLTVFSGDAVLADGAVKAIYFIFVILGSLYGFANRRVISRKSFTIIFTVMMAAYSLGCYSLASMEAERERYKRLPAVKAIEQHITRPANILFLNVPKRMALDYIVWGKDYSSRMSWEGRVNLTDASPVTERRIDTILGYLSSGYPTYVVSGEPIEFIPEMGDSTYSLLAKEQGGLFIYKITQFKPRKVRSVLNIDLGEKASRAFLLGGWSKDEGPYPEIGFPSFVWATGNYSEIIFTAEEKIDKGVLMFRAKSIIANQVVELRLNSVTFDKLEVKTGWDRYSIPLPPIPGDGKKNLLGMSFSRSVRAGSTKDTRELAVAFDWIRVDALQ
jgi:hypothetical protein